MNPGAGSKRYRERRYKHLPKPDRWRWSPFTLTWHRIPEGKVGAACGAWPTGRVADTPPGPLCEKCA